MTRPQLNSKQIHSFLISEKLKFVERSLPGIANKRK